MSTVTETDLISRASSYLRAYDFDGLSGLYASDVLLDAHVPLWRFQLQGADTILEALHEELTPLGRPEVVASSVHRMDHGVVVELEVHAHPVDGRRLWQEVHVLIGDGQEISEHRLYCTGVWDEATIERHRVEGTMVHR